MEIANPGRVRQAVADDRQGLQALLREAPLTHFHADWFLPADWLGLPSFVVGESGANGRQEPLRACLAAAADPLPAAWVRVAAVARGESPLAWLTALLAPACQALAASGATVLGWLATEGWPDHWLPALGFTRHNAIETYIQSDLGNVPQADGGSLVIRPAVDDDLPRLAVLEERAFGPLWRHSVPALRRAQAQALSFDVVERASEVLAFQYSARTNDGGAHLVRITVDPGAQRMGVGSLLLAHAMAGYRRQRLDYVTLNTQADNLPSHRLYAKFGFRQAGRQMPVWALKLSPDD